MVFHRQQGVVEIAMVRLLFRLTIRAFNGKWPQKIAEYRVSLGEAAQRGTIGIGMSFSIRLREEGFDLRESNNIDASAHPN